MCFVFEINAYRIQKKKKTRVITRTKRRECEMIQLFCSNSNYVVGSADVMYCHIVIRKIWTNEWTCRSD